MDLEIIGMTLVGEEAKLLKYLLTHIPLWNKPAGTIRIPMHGPTTWTWCWIFNLKVRTVSIGVKIELGGSSDSGGRGLAVGPLWNKSIPAISLHSDSESSIDKVNNKTYNGIQTYSPER